MAIATLKEPFKDFHGSLSKEDKYYVDVSRTMRVATQTTEMLGETKTDARSVRARLGNRKEKASPRLGYVGPMMLR